MNPSACHRYLEALLNDLDSGRPPRRPSRLLSALAMTSALCLSTSLPANADTSGEEKAEICDNGLDDDRDGDIDCDDRDCVDFCDFNVPEYSGPWMDDHESDCSDFLDNDDDGDIDCADPDCEDSIDCSPEKDDGCTCASSKPGRYVYLGFLPLVLLIRRKPRSATFT